MEPVAPPVADEPAESVLEIAADRDVRLPRLVDLRFAHDPPAVDLATAELEIVHDEPVPEEMHSLLRDMAYAQLERSYNSLEEIRVEGGERASEAKWRAERMAKMFQMKIEYYRENGGKALL